MAAVRCPGACFCSNDDEGHRLFGILTDCPLGAFQELRRVEDAWQMKLAGEMARLRQQHRDELTATSIKHRQVRRHRA